MINLLPRLLLIIVGFFAIRVALAAFEGPAPVQAKNIRPTFAREASLR